IRLQIGFGQPVAVKEEFVLVEVHIHWMSVTLRKNLGMNSLSHMRFRGAAGGTRSSNVSCLNAAEGKAGFHFGHGRRVASQGHTQMRAVTSTIEGCNQRR